MPDMVGLLTPTDRAPESVVAMAGDWHGNTVWAMHWVTKVAERGVSTLFHLGDCGVWPGPKGKRYLTRLEEVCAPNGITIYVTPGNHEDWARLNDIKPKSHDDLGPILWLTEHIAVLPRGHRFTYAGRSFVSLGGAPSLDFENRIEGETWWPEEAITQGDVDRVVAGGESEVMLTHDAPGHPYQTGPVATMCVSNPWGWSKRATSYAAVGRERLTRAFEAVKPKLLVHGHYHVDAEREVELPGGGTCRVISLPHEVQAGNLSFIDLEVLDRWDG